MTTPQDDAGGTARSVWLVARREIVTRLASKAFRIMTIVMVVATIARPISSVASKAACIGLLPMAMWR